ncbi:hypothetical protein [Sinomonas sp. ASV322]|uniref:hypothetical protein n=1 Tax=Sinomonas sp. ASV322 TaxID=3041920 RepID=UPI0027DDCB41|nr:hypothetical protein [Sinomonas sp. ASV322]MDQ4502797.1 hypothetical protein [Sinomonas sp. ASV322]
MSWFFWVAVFAWVIPIIVRRMSQGRGGRQIPPRDRGYNRYGGYPGNPYPRGVPGMRPPQTGQTPGSQNPSGQNPSGQTNGGQTQGGPTQGGPTQGGQTQGGQASSRQPGQLPAQAPSGSGNWWEHPIPPGTFPGQVGVPREQAPRQPSPGAPRPGATMPTRQGTPPLSAANPAPPVPEAQGYRARKLAELDQQFTDQKISLEEYMKARNEIMRG